MRRALATGLTCVAAAGCGGSDAPSHRPAPPPGLGPAPKALLDACAREQIACPRWWPERLDGGPMPARAVRTMEPRVLLDIANGFCGRRACRGIFHADIGQQAAPFPPVSERLRFPTETRTIPVRGGGTFVQQRAPKRLAVTTVHGARATVYQAAGFPQGGLHGGHVAVLWNAPGGRIVSVHAQGLPRREAVRIALAIARSEPR